MIRTIKPKNNRSKRALAKKELKKVENVKTALFIPGKSCNQFLHDCMVDLSALKKPDIKRFNKKNDILPFEDASKLEFLSEKNDASLLVLATHNKKRPNTLTFARTFNYKIYDMIELSVLNNYKLLKDFKKQTMSIGLKPVFVFNGAIFETDPTYRHLKSLFLDFFRGEVFELHDLAGLQHIISISALEMEDSDNVISPTPIVNFRVYKLKTFKSAQPKLPRVEIDEIGPRLNFKIGRVQEPSEELVKEAMEEIKQAKSRKNVETDQMGDQIANVHVGKQDLSKLQTRKMKGLKSRYDQLSDEEDEDEIEEGDTVYQDAVEEYSSEEEEEEENDDDEPVTKKSRKN